jgi:peptidoglycan/xylan/chitin deacetylase (PgdA/CDA1 family)
MAIHPSGMDHLLYGYSSLPGRPRLEWPERARLAVCLNLYFETFSYEPRPGTIRDPRWRDRFQHDCRMYTWYEYGNRVGIFRILDLLDRHRWRATVASNALACERFPYLVKAFQSRGYEFAAHGTAANEMITAKMAEDEERAALAESIARVEKATGGRPRGWISQDYAASVRAPQFLSELGVRYVADWPNDEQPYLMNSGLVSMPNYSEWDDVRLLWDRRLQMPRYPQILGEAFDQLYADSGETGRLFSFNIHPWILGAAHRIRYLEEVIDKIAGTPNLWVATAGEVADYTSETAKS